MAPPRKQAERPVLTSRQLGSEALEETSIGLAVPGEYPEGYDEMDDRWKKRFDHAAKKGNTVKASMLYADAEESE